MITILDLFAPFGGKKTWHNASLRSIVLKGQRNQGGNGVYIPRDLNKTE